MSIYKIFPTKDTSLYTISQSMNTGLDEIIEASTYIKNDAGQVSRYLLHFSQTEINNWNQTYISGSGVSVIASFPDASDLIFDQTMIGGPNYPTSSDGEGGNPGMVWDLIPSSSTGNGKGQHFNVQANGSYFIPNRDILTSSTTFGGFLTASANDGTYGPFILSNVDAAATVATSSLSASINLVIKNNEVISSIIINNGSASYVSQSYQSYLGSDLYLSQQAIDDTVGAGVITLSNPTIVGDDRFYFNIQPTDLVTTIDVLHGIKPYGIGYNPGDQLVFKSESFAGYPFSDDITLTLSTPAVSSSNWSDREFGVDLVNSAAVVNGLNIDQKLMIYPVSGSWGMGSGKFYNNPIITDGASWRFTNYSGSTATGAGKWNITGTLKMGQILDNTYYNTVTTLNAGTVAGFVADGSVLGTGAIVEIESVLVGAINIIKGVRITSVGSDYQPGTGSTITITAAIIGATALGAASADLIINLVSSNIDCGNRTTTSFTNVTNAGGGNWYTGSSLGLDIVCSQSFSYGIGVDLNVDVTNTIKTWTTHSLVDNTIGFKNDGFIVKQSGSREFLNNVNTQATFRYFSIDTNTIYPPLLNLKWNDYYFNTGSSSNTTLDTPEAFISVYNNAGTYYSESVERFRLAAIPKYPDVVFQTASLYTTNYFLPKDSSSYAIKDTDTNEFVIPFDSTYTQISSDTTSSYFDVYMNGLEPERYYTILIKTTIGGTTKVFDEDIMFKLING